MHSPASGAVEQRKRRSFGVCVSVAPGLERTGYPVFEDTHLHIGQIVADRLDDRSRAFAEAFAIGAHLIYSIGHAAPWHPLSDADVRQMQDHDWQGGVVFGGAVSQLPNDLISQRSISRGSFAADRALRLYDQAQAAQEGLS